MAVWGPIVQGAVHRTVSRLRQWPALDSAEKGSKPPNVWDNLLLL